MNGNTATYMQYAYARVLSIFAKGGSRHGLRLRASGCATIDAGDHPVERALARGARCNFRGSADAQTAAEYRPNFLTAYLFEVANRYSSFFEQCPGAQGAQHSPKRVPAGCCCAT